MSKQVLWLDNDVAYVTPYKEALEEADYCVTLVRTVGEAGRRMHENPYDLVILDVMVPTKSEEEEKVYPPSDTDSGTKTGLVFYRRFRQEFNARQTRVFVFTVILDEGVKKEFLAAGLPLTNFATKLALREEADFLERIRTIMSL